MAGSSKQMTMVRTTTVWAALTLSALTWSAPAVADQNSAAAFTACAEITENERRLACFDVVTAAIRDGGNAMAAFERFMEETHDTAQAAQAAATERARLEAEQAQVLSDHQAELAERARREAEQSQALAERQAELAAREAELAARQAEIVARQAEIEAAERAAQAAATEPATAEALARAEEEARQARTRAAEAEDRAREAEERARRSEEREGFFSGLSLPFANRLPETIPELFGARDLPDDAVVEITRDIDMEAVFRGEEIDRITAPVTRAGRNNAGKYFVVLENGHLWRQQDSSRVLAPRGGPDSVVIERGALGAFFMRLEGRGRAIRVERVR